jgi:hypothetical protein
MKMIANMWKLVVLILVIFLCLMGATEAIARGGGGHSRSYSSASSHSRSGDVQVKGYTRKNGTYVQPHHRSQPNETKTDNFSTKGNVNPYNGKPGSKDP